MKTILFVCVHNAGRSRMAEAFFNEAPPEGFIALSAGTEPGERVNPAVADAMAELGFDMSGDKPQLLTDAMSAGAEIVITMGCGVDTACPLFAGIKAHEDWGLDDPAGQPTETVRRIRNEVRSRVDELKARLFADKL